MCHSFDDLQTWPPWVDLVRSPLGLLLALTDPTGLSVLGAWTLHLFSLLSVLLRCFLLTPSACHTPFFSHLQISNPRQGQEYLPLTGYRSFKFTSFTSEKSRPREMEHSLWHRFRELVLHALASFKKCTWKQEWALRADPSSNPIPPTANCDMSGKSFHILQSPLPHLRKLATFSRAVQIGRTSCNSHARS